MDRMDLGPAMTNPATRPLPEAQLGPAEKLLDLVLSAGDPLWHNRLGREVGDNELGYKPAAIAMIVSTRRRRGNTVKGAAAALQVPFSEIEVAAFEDPYQVPRVLRTLLEAPTPAAVGLTTARPRTSWVEKVMATPLLTRPAAARP